MNRATSLRNFVTFLSALLLICISSQTLSASIAAKDAKVWIKSPTNGAIVTSPVKVRFGVRGMSIIPAGIVHPESGHHHLLIDTGLPDLSLPIPADDKHIHFGKGQKETTVELSPGRHTLQLLLGDHNHIPHDKPVVSQKITITVVEPMKKQADKPRESRPADSKGDKKIHKKIPESK